MLTQWRIDLGDEDLAGATEPAEGRRGGGEGGGPVRPPTQLIGGEAVTRALHVLVNVAQQHRLFPHLPLRHFPYKLRVLVYLYEKYKIQKKF